MRELIESKLARQSTDNKQYKMVDNTKCEKVNTQQTHTLTHTRLAKRPATYRNIAVSFFFFYAAAHVAALPRARLRPAIIAIALRNETHQPQRYTRI